MSIEHIYQGLIHLNLMVEDLKKHLDSEESGERAVVLSVEDIRCLMGMIDYCEAKSKGRVGMIDYVGIRERLGG